MIDKTNPIPLYYQIQNDLFSEIESGKYHAGDRLPSERDLAVQYDVTRMTVRQAIKNLVEQGYLEVRQGSGMYVTDRFHMNSNQTVRKGTIIGVLLPNIQRGIMIDLIRGIEDQAIATGYNTILCNSDDRFEKANMYTKQLTANNVSGVIYLPIQDIENSDRKEEANRHIVEAFIQANIPIVLVDRECRTIDTDIVVSDNYGGGFELAEHLIEMGHSRIAVIYDFVETSIEDRIRGYKNALQKHQIPFDPQLVQKIREYGHTDSFQNALKEMVHTLGATAIMAMNDLLAADIFYLADKIHISIPEELSLVGYDDLPFSKRLPTPLTTVNQPIYQMGAESFNILKDRMEHHPIHLKKVILPNRLVKRKSVKRL